MAVESRFVVIRNGVEAKTFMDKKSADEYDKMLDMADNLSQVLEESSIELSDSANEELSIFLAQHREDVLVALLAKKPAKKPVKKTVEKAVEVPAESSVSVVDSAEENPETKPAAKPAAKPRKTRAKAATEKLSEAS